MSTGLSKCTSCLRTKWQRYQRPNAAQLVLVHRLYSVQALAWPGSRLLAYQAAKHVPATAAREEARIGWVLAAFSQAARIQRRPVARRLEQVQVVRPRLQHTSGS